MKTEVVTSATGEPVSLDEIKDQLRIERGETAEDDLLNGLISAARDRAETYTGRRLLTQTWKAYYQKWSTGEYFELPYPPLQAIQSSGLIYKNSTGNSTTVWSSGDSQWEVDTVSEPGRLHLKYGEDWPTETLWNVNPISIQYICGYGTTDRGYSSQVPEPIKLGMKMLIGHWYENRENTIVGKTVEEIPEATKALWYPYRIWDRQF